MGDTTGLRAKEIFLAALDEPEPERARFVAQACGADAGLRQRVHDLLAAHGRAAVLDRVIARRAKAARSRPAEPLPPADALRFGDYEIESEIASGAMGTVYRARQLSLGRMVALKMLRVGRFATESEVRRFRAEAEAVARLDHPGIVPVYEVGECEGRHFFSMKLVDGPSLATAEGRYREDPRAAARLVAGVARAVHHAHLHGVLHRDLKPSNILLDAEGNAYVADFGIAKRVDADFGAQGDATVTGWICGTPTYMAPEQAEARGDVTVASDVYSLGCVLYALLAGRPPFAADSWVEVLRKLRVEEPPRLRELGVAVERDLETIVLHCLAKEPARRYASALALARDLERWLEHLPIEVRPASPFERARLLYRRHPLPTALAAIVALLLILLAVGATTSSVLLRERLRRAQEAEARATERLRGSLLAQARALRLGSQPGRRAESLALLEQAAAIAPGPDVRDEAITCMSTVDLGPLDAWPLEVAGSNVIGVDRARERLAIALPDGGILIQERGGSVSCQLPASEGIAWRARFSPDGRRLLAKFHAAVGTASAHFSVFDLETGERRSDLPGFVNSLALDYDPKGRWYAIGLRGEVLVIDAHTGGELWRIAAGSWPSALRFSPDGTRLALGSSGWRTIELYEFPGARRRGEFASLPAETSAIDWSADGSILAVGCHDFRVHLFSYPGLEPLRELSGHQAEVSDLHFGTDDLLASYAWDETSRLWDVHTGEELVIAEAHAFGFSADGRRLAYVTNEELGWWKVERDETFRILHGHRGKSPTCVVADPHGRWLATGGSDGVIVRELASGRRLALLGDEDVTGLAFGRGGELLWSSGDAGLLRWPMPSALEAGNDATPLRLLEGRSGKMSASADGRVPAVVHRGGVQVLFDGDGSSEGLRLEGFPGMDNPALTPDGALVAVGSWRGSGVRVWRVSTGELEVHLLPEESATQPCFSPDGELLAVGTRNEYRVWRVADWSVARVFPRPVLLGNLAGALAFDAEGGRLAIASSRRTIELVDPRSGARLAALSAADPQPVMELCFLPGEQGLAAATTTRRALLWRLGAIEAELRARGLDPELSLAPRTARARGAARAGD